MHLKQGLRGAMLIGVLGIWILPIAAVSAPDQNKEEVLPQQGLLAAAGNLPMSGVSLPLPIGMKAGQVAPITGGVSRAGGTCDYQVTNNFEYPIQVALTVRQYSSQLKRTASKSLSERLKPGETKSGQLQENTGTAGCALVLESWKRK